MRAAFAATAPTGKSRWASAKVSLGISAIERPRGGAAIRSFYSACQRGRGIGNTSTLMFAVAVCPWPSLIVYANVSRPLNARLGA